MFKFIKHFTSKTKILLIGFVLILIPVVVISYLSMKSVNQKAENLRLNYSGTIRLVKDKLENGIINLEENLQIEINEFKPNQNKPELQQWLNVLEKKDSVFQNLFLVNNENGLLLSTISCNWLPISNTNNFEEKLLLQADFRSAEKAEFSQKNYMEAIRFYREAVFKTKDDGSKAFLLARIGRCYFKSGKYEKGIEEYNKLLQLRETRIGKVPSGVVALSQLSQGYSDLQESEKQLEATFELYRYLLEHPWDISDGNYQFYLNSTISELKKQKELYLKNDTLLAKLNSLDIKKTNTEQQIKFLKLLQQYLIPEMESNINRNNVSENQKHKIWMDENGNGATLYYFLLPATFQTVNLKILGFQFNENYLLKKQIPEILSTIELGKDLLLGILDKNDRLLFIQNGHSVRNHLVTENFEVVFANWKVALFNRDGQTIDELVGKEKNLYQMLFTGIILLMLMGLIVIVRAVIHESEMARIKSEFVSSVSHELKTPLALIRMFGETLDSGIVSDEKKRKEFYKIIRTESERLTHLINNVLDFSKMDTGQKKYSFSETDLVQVVRSSLEAYKFHIHENGFEIRGEFPEEPVFLNIDQDSISQAVLNLMSNAVKYSGERKFIEVRVQKNETSAIISVSDKGMGIPKNEWKKIFEKFYRVSNEDVQGKRGTGLGLTLTKQIVEAHGGTIKVESEVGKGSTFTIRIPLKL